MFNWSQNAIKYMLLHFLLSIPAGMTLVQLCVTSQLHCFDNCNKLINALPVSNFTSLPSNLKNAIIVTFWNCTEQNISRKMSCIHNETQIPLNSTPGPIWSGHCLPLCPLYHFPRDSRCVRYIKYCFYSPFRKCSFFHFCNPFPNPFLLYPTLTSLWLLYTLSF